MKLFSDHALSELLCLQLFWRGVGFFYFFFYVCDTTIKKQVTVWIETKEAYGLHQCVSCLVNTAVKQEVTVWIEIREAYGFES